MRYRKLGRTGLTVSEIGFGCWGLGGDSYGPTDDYVSIRSLRLAFELGVNFFDTADTYGNGHSEEVIGKALSDVRGQIILATKGGTLPHFGFEMPQDFSPEHLREAVEASLKRLKTDYIDLYQLHSPPSDLLIDKQRMEEIVELIIKVKEEGKILHFGISLRTPQDGLIVVRDLGFGVVQVNFNLIDQRSIENGLFHYCERTEVGVIARTPFAFGFLSGCYSRGEKFYPPDHRSNWPQKQIDLWAQAPEFFAPLNINKNRSIAQLSLAFCLALEAVSTVIPGMMTEEEVKCNTAIADLAPLTAEELAEIKKIYTQNIFYLGRKVA